MGGKTPVSCLLYGTESRSQTLRFARREFLSGEIGVTLCSVPETVHW